MYLWGYGRKYDWSGYNHWNDEDWINLYLCDFIEQVTALKLAHRSQNNRKRIINSGCITQEKPLHELLGADTGANIPAPLAIVRIRPNTSVAAAWIFELRLSWRIGCTTSPRCSVNHTCFKAQSRWCLPRISSFLTSNHPIPLPPKWHYQAPRIFVFPNSVIDSCAWLWTFSVADLWTSLKIGTGDACWVLLPANKSVHLQAKYRIAHVLLSSSLMSREYVKLGSLDYPLASNHITFFAYELHYDSVYYSEYWLIRSKHRFLINLDKSPQKAQ